MQFIKLWDNFLETALWHHMWWCHNISLFTVTSSLVFCLLGSTDHWSCTVRQGELVNLRQSYCFELITMATGNYDIIKGVFSICLCVKWRPFIFVDLLEVVYAHWKLAFTYKHVGLYIYSKRSDLFEYWYI